MIAGAEACRQEHSFRRSLGLVVACGLIGWGCDRTQAPSSTKAELGASAADSAAPLLNPETAEDLSALRPAPDAVNEEMVVRLDAIATLRWQLDQLRRERTMAELTSDVNATGDPESVATSAREQRQDLDLQIMRVSLDRWCERMTLSDEELVLWGQLAESRVLAGDSLRMLVDPDGNGVVEPEAVGTLLQYSKDLARQEQNEMLRAYDADGDGAYSDSEAARAMEALRSDLADFERLRGVDVDLDGRASADEIERYIREYQRGSERADLNRDGRVDGADLVRFSRAITG